MGLRSVCYEKTCIKKQMKRVLDSALPTMFKLSAMHELIKVSSKSGLFKFRDFYSLNFDRFSTSDLHKGCVTVSEHDCIDEMGFSSWHKAMTWICKQAKVCGSEYVVDSGHYRYRVYFPTNQE